MDLEHCRAIPVFAGVLAGLLGSPSIPSASAAPTVNLIAMLPAGDRTSIVLELNEPIRHIEELEAGPHTLVIEAGPIASGFQAQRLTPVPASSLLDSVVAHEFIAPDGTGALRLYIQLRGQVAHSRRLAGSRLYLDFAPQSSGGAPPRTFDR